MIQRTTRGPPNAQTGSTSNQLTPKAPYKPAPAKAGGTRWDQVLFVLVAYRLLAPGSEWRLPREWFQRSALADLLGEDAGLAEIHKLYRCHDRLLTHKQAVFDHLMGRVARPVQHQLRCAALCALSPSQALSTGSPQFVHITCCCESGELDFLGREWTRLCFAVAACRVCRLLPAPFDGMLDDRTIVGLA
jgi:hypothetical protein